jgi:hypothetical protein
MRPRQLRVALAQPRKDLVDPLDIPWLAGQVPFAFNTSNTAAVS